MDLDNQFVVIDTSEIGKDLLAAGTFTATDFCTEKCKESRVKKKALILDELWALIGASSNPQAAEFVLECSKTYRAFGAAVIGATQDLNDFFALENGKFGRDILNNSRIKVVLPLEEEEAVRVKEVMDLSNEEMDAGHPQQAGGGAALRRAQPHFGGFPIHPAGIRLDHHQPGRFGNSNAGPAAGKWVVVKGPFP